MQSQVSLYEGGRGKSDIGRRGEGIVILAVLAGCAHKPRNVRSYQKLKEVRNGFPPELLRKYSPANTMTSV